MFNTFVVNFHPFCSFKWFSDNTGASIVLNSGQKMALRAFYFIRALTKALTYNYINRSQRHLLAAIENNWFGVPIIKLFHFLNAVEMIQNPLLVKGSPLNQSLLLINSSFLKGKSEKHFLCLIQLTVNKCRALEKRCKEPTVVTKILESSLI